MGGGISGGLFHRITSLPNLFLAWKEFRRGKRTKPDVAAFEFNLEDNIFKLHDELTSREYVHAAYTEFYVCDPKRRHIHKASVRDRLLHQAIFQILYPIFDRHFVFDSYSSRVHKGTHRAVFRLVDACRKATQNWRMPAYVLKCDIRKFFDSISHQILRRLISDKISDADTLWLLDRIFESFHKDSGRGLPLGNVTSQLFANIYLNGLDQFVKHSLKAHHFFRYCDDFVIVHTDRVWLEHALAEIRTFLQEDLSLDLHPDKVEIRKVLQGIDFLGYVVLPHAIVLRTKTKRRIIRKIKLAKVEYRTGIISKENFQSIINSYLGIVSHSKDGKLRIMLHRLLNSL